MDKNEVALARNEGEMVMADLLGFDADQVSRLTSLSSAQLSYWNKTNFYSPTLGYSRPGYGSIYSFRDVVALKTIAGLREQVPLQELRRVGNWLRERHEAPWTTLIFWVINRKVVFADPGTGIPREAISGQDVMEVSLEPIAHELEAEIHMLSDRGGKIGKIEKRQRYISNAARVAGTRIRTASIWEYHKAGYSTDKIVHELPGLTPEDVRAAIEYEETEDAVA